MARVMAVDGLEGRHKRRFKKTTIPDAQATAPWTDLLARDFTPADRPLNQAWVGDITYIRTWQGQAQEQPALRQRQPERGPVAVARIRSHDHLDKFAGERSRGEAVHLKRRARGMGGRACGKSQFVVPCKRVSCNYRFTSSS